MFLVSMLRTGCYVKQMKSIQFFNPSSVIYMRTHVNFSTIANICWLIQTFKYQCCGFQVHFKSILMCNLKTKGDFFYQMSTLHSGLHNKFELYVFPIFIGFEFCIYRLYIVLNLKCMHAVFPTLWPFQQMLVPCYSTGSSVAKLFCGCMYICVYICMYVYMYIPLYIQIIDYSIQWLFSAYIYLPVHYASWPLSENRSFFQHQNRCSKFRQIVIVWWYFIMWWYFVSMTSNCLAFGFLANRKSYKNVLLTVYSVLQLDY